MKLLVFGDIHGRSFWKESVEQYMDECDKVIFVGDYVDPYGDENITRKQAISVLDEIITLKKDNQDKVVLLIGNHDAHYAIKGFDRSSRYDSSNAHSIKERFLSHRNLFKLAHEETVNGKRILFTHAGLMNSWVNRNKDVITDISAEGLNTLLHNPKGVRALCEVSRYRSSWFGEKSGSILWSDIMEKADIDLDRNITIDKDSVVDGYDYQIFGHTYLDNEIITDKWACIDCRKPFLVDENGNLRET